MSTPRPRNALLSIWLDLLNQVDGPACGHPEAAVGAAIPLRHRRLKRTRRLTGYSHVAHVAALTARLRRARPL